MATPPAPPSSSWSTVPSSVTCDRLIALDAGRIITAGPPAEVLDDPAVVRAYLGGAAPVTS